MLRLTLAAALAAAGAAQIVRPGVPWFDTIGERVYAGGGGFWREGGLWYWIGEGNKVYQDLSQGFNLYSSPSLASDSWTPYGYVLLNTSILAPQPGPYRMERPKLFRCPGTSKWTVWFHCDTAGFTMTSVGVAYSTSGQPQGPYSMAAQCFEPDGQKSYDMGVYVPGDGHAYLVRSVGNQFAGISRLNADCSGLDGQGIISHGPRIEGQALMSYEGRYYLWGSHLTGWAPNPAVFSVADAPGTLNTTWTVLGNPSNDSTTFNSQSTFLIQVPQPSGRTTYIYAGDRWNPSGPGGLQNATYIWLPLTPPGPAGGNWTMPWRDSWNVSDF